ncbi:MAG: hypothetical protein HC794_05140 [Nitrospiraceae bacterium]|nr:hypothetical protein [Nitrospiraceae bacterium]
MWHNLQPSLAYAVRFAVPSARAAYERVVGSANWMQLVAAMNPCRCGYLSDAERACSRAPKCASEYQSKLSGPLIDRIDLHVEVPAVTLRELRSDAGERSEIVADRVARTQDVVVVIKEKEADDIDAMCTSLYLRQDHLAQFVAGRVA